MFVIIFLHPDASNSKDFETIGKRVGAITFTVPRDRDDDALSIHHINK